MDFFKSFSFISSGISSALAIYKNPPPEKAKKNRLNNSTVSDKIKAINPPSNATIALKKLKRRAFFLVNPPYRSMPKSPIWVLSFDATS